MAPLDPESNPTRYNAFNAPDKPETEASIHFEPTQNLIRNIS